MKRFSRFKFQKIIAAMCYTISFKNCIIHTLNNTNRPNPKLILLLLHRQAALSFLTFIVRGGKSGQRRAPCFLAGRSLKGDSSVTENDHLVLMYLNGERVKRCGKSAPVPAAMSGAVRLTGCKAMYILIVCRCCGTARLPALFLFAQGSQEG